MNYAVFNYTEATFLLCYLFWHYLLFDMNKKNKQVLNDELYNIICEMYNKVYKKIKV